MTTPAGDSLDEMKDAGQGRVFAQPVVARVLCSVPLIIVAGGFLGAGLADERAQATAGGVAAGLGIAALVTRFWRLRVVLGDGVTAVNWVRTIHVPWSNVERFGQDADGTVWVRTRDLNVHRFSAFGAPRADPFGWARAQNDRAASALEAARKRRRRRGGA